MTLLILLIPPPPPHHLPPHHSPFLCSSGRNAYINPKTALIDHHASLSPSSASEHNNSRPWHSFSPIGPQGPVSETIYSLRGAPETGCWRRAIQIEKLPLIFQSSQKYIVSHFGFRLAKIWVSSAPTINHCAPGSSRFELPILQGTSQPAEVSSMPLHLSPC